MVECASECGVVPERKKLIDQVARVSQFIGDGLATSLTPCVVRYQQPLDHFAVLQMGLDDFVNILVVHIGVPDCLRIDHCYRAGGAAVQATRLVDSYLARSGQSGGFDLKLAPIKALLRVLPGATFLSVLSVVETEEYMSLVVGRLQSGRPLRTRLFIACFFNHGEILVFQARTTQLIEHIHQSRVGPEPPKPLGEAVKADESPLLPG